MPETDFKLSRAEYQALYERYRDIKHDINNVLAIIMALSELGQRNPAHYEKLAKAVLLRGPEVVEKLAEFQTMLSAPLKAQPLAADAAESEPA